MDPFKIAASRDIEVKAKPDTAEGVSGMLLRHGNTFGILYATHIPSEGFQRFRSVTSSGIIFLKGTSITFCPRTESTYRMAGSFQPTRMSWKPIISAQDC